MAWGTKYRFNIYSHLVGTYWKADLALKDYEGAITTGVELSAEAALTISLEGQGGSKYLTANGNALKGTSATLSICIENSTQAAAFLAFATVEVEEWKLLIYKGTAPGNETIYHELFIQPDVYQFPYSAYPYFIQLTANDEIGRLNSVSFAQSSGARYTVRATIMYFIFECLNKLGINREVREVCNLYCAETDAAAADSSLAQVTVDPKKYLNRIGREDEAPMSCHEVLNDIFKTFGIVMHLGSDNRWFLKRVNEIAGTSYIQRILSDATSVESSATITNHLVATNTETGDGIVTFINNPTVVMDWRWKRAEIQFFVGLARTFVLDGDFAPDKWTDENTLANWDKFFRFPSVNHTLTYVRRPVDVLRTYQAGRYIDGDIANSSLFEFTVNTGTSYIQATDSLDGYPSFFKVEDKVILSAASGSTLPAPLLPGQVYYVINMQTSPPDADSDADVHQFRLSLTAGGGFINITTNGTGTFFIGKEEQSEFDWVAQLNGYQTALWSDDVIDNKAGIKSDPVEVVAGGGTSFELSFWWRIIFDNGLIIQDNPAEAYYLAVLETPAGSKYYYDNATLTWELAASASDITVNVLADSAKLYNWTRQPIQPASFPADGFFYFILLTPSSASNTDTLGVQYGNIKSAFLINGSSDIEYVAKEAEIGSDYAYNAEPIVVLTGDTPSDIYSGFIGAPGGGLTTDWYRRGVTETKELLDILLQSYMNNYGRTTRKITGTLMANFSADKCVKDSNLDYPEGAGTHTPVFMITGGTLNVENGTWDAEFTEIRE